jgi:hypothetical protein
MNAQKKEEVISSILAKESPNLEQRLQRYGEKNFRDLFVISKKWLGLIWNYFSNSRAFMKIGGLRVDTREVQGPFCKVAGIKEFRDLIYNEKNLWTESTVRWTVGGTGPRWTADKASEVAHQRTARTAPPCMEPRRG